MATARRPLFFFYMYLFYWWKGIRSKIENTREEMDLLFLLSFLAYMNLVPMKKWNRRRVSQKANGSLRTRLWEASADGYCLGEPPSLPFIITYPGKSTNSTDTQREGNNCPKFKLLSIRKRSILYIQIVEIRQRTGNCNWKLDFFLEVMENFAKKILYIHHSLYIAKEVHELSLADDHEFSHNTIFVSGIWYW